MAKREMKTAKTEETVIDETINETVVEEVATEETVVEEVVAEETVEDVTPKILLGVVTSCSKLNVRKKANLKADVVSVINVKTEVTVNPDESTKEWYKVTINGVEGFCMKKFITIKD